MHQNHPRGMRAASAAAALLLIGVGLSSEAAYVTTVLNDPDLIAYYRLNETSGVDAFDAGGTHHANYVGSIPGDNMAGPGPGNGFGGLDATNTAPDFASVAGATDSVVLPDAPFDREVISIAGFFKTNNPSGSYRRLYNTDGSATYPLSISANGDEFLIVTAPATASDQGKKIDNVAALSDNTWHHWVLVRNGDSVNNLRFYLDGVLLPMTNTTGAGFDTGTRIGMRGQSDPGFGWQGGIDEVAFFDRALDQDDVRSLHWAARGPYPPPADPTAHETFQYGSGGTPVELHGQNGGLGFSGPWTAATTATEVVPVGTPLTFDTQATVINGGSRALELSANVQPAASRGLDETFTGDVFVSFLVRWDQGSVDDNDFASMFLGTGSPSTEPSFGVKGNRETGSGPEDFYVRFAPGSEAYASQITDNTTTHMVVGRLFKDSGTGNYDRFSLWVDPAWWEWDTPHVTAIGDAGFDSLSAFGLKAWNLDGDDSVLFDELRFGHTWSAVMPIPEPAGATLVLIAMALLAGCRPRRRQTRLAG